MKQADNDGKHSDDERIAALTMLGELWLNFTRHIDEKGETTNNLLQVVKRGARDRHRPIRMVAVG
jgi:anti-sigma-K factor RskA